jgi:hypothetical protein
MITATVTEHVPWKKRQAALKSEVTIDRLCTILGVETLSDWSDGLDGCETYSHVYKEVLASGASESEAEEQAGQAESDELGEATEKYRAAVLAVAERLFAEHRLTLVERADKWSYRVVPEKSWLDSLGAIVQTINGVGTFEFRNARELCESGPWTPRQAVLSHLGWIADWPDVYEGSKAKSLVERQLR